MVAPAFDCACCGPADTPHVRGLPDAPRSVLASLCDTCASGQCDTCNGLTSGAETPGSGYVEVRSDICLRCGGNGVIADWWQVGWREPDERSCPSCSGLGYTVDPTHGLTSMPPDWCHYLSLTNEETRNV